MKLAMPEARYRKFTITTLYVQAFGR